MIAIAACFPVSLAAADTGASAVSLSATASQSIHPLLIRNEHNPLMRVTIDAPKGESLVRMKSFTFSLEGTDALGDLASLQLFYSGETNKFVTDRPFGDLTGPAREVVFQGDQALNGERHYFWLSVRLRADADLAHRVDSVCVGVTTLSGATLVPHDESQGVRNRIGIALRKHDDDGVNTYRIPALARTPKGTLLCVYDMRRRRSRDLQEDIDIGLSRSTNGGRTWAPAQVIMDMGEWGGLPQEQNGCSDPGILVDQNTGEIFCFAVWMWGKPGKHQWNGDGSEPGFEIGKSAQFLMVRSTDDGVTWTAPENLTRKLKKPEWWLFAPSPSAGITLKDGTLVMPSQGRDERGAPFSNIMLSRDHAQTWTVSAPAYNGSSECQAVELADGSLMLNMRNEGSQNRFFRSVCVTRDRGQTWRPHASHLTALVEPRCNGSLIRFENRVAGPSRSILLFANPHAQDGRHHQTIQASCDDGETWPKEYHLLLDEGSGRGYPSLAQIDDRHVGIVYEGSQADLMFESIPFRELVPDHLDENALGGKLGGRVGNAAGQGVCSPAFRRPDAREPDDIDSS